MRTSFYLPIDWLKREAEKLMRLINQFSEKDQPREKVVKILNKSVRSLKKRFSRKAFQHIMELCLRLVEIGDR